MSAVWMTAIPILLGGIALFLLGMELLGDGMNRTAGPRVQALLSNVAGSRLKGAGVGALASTLVHSGPATVIVLGFVNAGVVSLAQAIPLVFGANIGTTLSMQIVAFNVGKHCFLVIALGMLLRRLATTQMLKDISLIVIGFGMLFLGLETIKLAFAPLAQGNTLRDLVALMDTHSWTGFMQAFIAGALLTVLFQSSGVIVSLLFSLSAIGVVADYRMAVPFILGAHVGTCSMTLFAAPGGTPGAWRAAISHVVFNVVGGVIAVAMLPFYDWLMPRLTGDITRQIANFNTAKQVINVALLLPFTPLLEKGLRKATAWMGDREEEGSHLDPRLLSMPEDAILAVVRELRRQAGIVNQMLRATLDGLVTLDSRKFGSIASQEAAVDVIKRRISDYIAKIALRSLEPSRTVMLQRLVVASSAVERIGDHVEGIAWLSRQKVKNNVWFEDEHMRHLLAMSQLICEMLDQARDAIDPTEEGARIHATRALEQRERYRFHAKQLKESIGQWLNSGRGNATTVLMIHRFLSTYDRIVDQLKTLARQEKKETWTVRDSGLNRVEPLAPRGPGRPENHRTHDSFEAAVKDLRLDQGEAVIPAPSQSE